MLRNLGYDEWRPTLLSQIPQGGPGFASEVLSAASGTDSGPRPPLAPRLSEPLSARELQVLRFIAAGRSNPEIAEALYLSLNTVKWHAKNLYGKLGVRSRVQAAARGHELGLL